jgi:hypothetical protein
MQALTVTGFSLSLSLSLGTTATRRIKFAASLPILMLKGDRVANGIPGRDFCR